MDRIGADHGAVLRQIEKRLDARPLLLQLPFGKEGDFSGVIDLLTGDLLQFHEEDQGMTVERQPLPLEMQEEFRVAREAVIEAAADFDDTILSDYIDGIPVEPDRLRKAIRTGTVTSRLFPVFLGAALRNKGIQPLLDAVGAYLPSPLDIPPALGIRDGSDIAEEVRCDTNAPFCGLAFKVFSDEGRKLTFLRIYAGKVRAGAAVFNVTRNSMEKVVHLFRMHSHKRERVDVASAGDIVAATGLKDVLTGDTLCDYGHRILLKGLSIPDPVVSLAVEPKGAEDRDKLPLALEKLQWEDPTFRVREDEETGQTILTGMGELHLEIVSDRLLRDFGVEVKTGRPQVVYRETPKRAVEHREVFRRELEGKVHGGEVLLRLSPLQRGAGLRIVLPAPEESPLAPELLGQLGALLEQSCRVGGIFGYPLTDLEVRILEAPFDPGFTTDVGLRAAAQRGLMIALRTSGSALLEPIMSLELTSPAECTGRVLGSLQKKRGRVEGVSPRGGQEIVRASVPLAEMFGYMSEIRSATKGRGSFTMEFSHYDLAPAEAIKR
jgi:elongation factor G